MKQIDLIEAKNMKKYSITIASRAVADSLNNKIAIDSLFENGESITGESLHPGVNYTDDKRVYDSANEYAKDHKGVRVEMMPYGKKYVLPREFSKFRFVDGFSVFLEDESEYYTLTLYYQNTELVSITFDDGLKDPGKKYMVYVNQPYYENGKSTFVVRQKETDKQYIFLETGSAKVAFNMVNRIVSGMRYPKAKYVW